MTRCSPILGIGLALLTLSSLPHAQAAPRPQPYCIRGVSLERGGEDKKTLVLRDGAIEAILDESAPPPAGTRVVEGAGLICFPAFLDAFSRQGCAVPQPVKDQDLPPNEQADVGVDMRLANRKGIQPGFRAVEALSVTKDQSEAWRKAGFGAALVAPGDELLSGSSVLATTREAAMRDLVLRAEVFAHASFNASGKGYPSTPMGYLAQLRQFLHDSRRQLELERRYEQGRPGLRPPFDAELSAGATLVSGQRMLLCEAQGAGEVERWLDLAEEFDLRVGVIGGNETWRITSLLASRDVPVVLTLDWGKEVKDPRPKKKDPDASSPKEAPDEQEKPEAKAKKETGNAPDSRDLYDEPYAVRLERRKKWEDTRDCALRLQEAGLSLSFGSAKGKPSELLDRVRTLVKNGLPADAALTALTANSAELLGVGKRLGRIAPGFDATLTLWRADPLTDEKATVAWIFVDGFPSEFKEDKKAEPPAEGVDVTGTWRIDFDAAEGGPKSATLVIEMDKRGGVNGKITIDDPAGGSTVEAEVEGQVSKSRLELEASLTLGARSFNAVLTATIDKDALEGDASFRSTGSEQPVNQPFHGSRTPAPENR